MKTILLACLLLMSATATAQDWLRSDDGELLLRSFDTAPFPHESRKDGFKGSAATYPVEPHYTDSTIGIFIPAQFKPGDTVDFVVHFHGHMNHVDQVFTQFSLAGEVRRSGVNAILLVPQGPRDAADSGGGKMEDPDGFARMIQSVATFLKDSGKIAATKIGRITLTAHSGGYRAVSFIARVGGMREQIRDIILFDASYGQLDGFADFAKLGNGRRLVSIFTEHLANENVQLMSMLQRQGVDFTITMEADLKPEMLQQRRPTFIHTVDLAHNDVVSKRGYFASFIAAGYTRNPAQ